MRNVIRAMTVIATLSLGPATPARAADTIFTPVLFGGTTAAGTTAILSCNVLNTATTSQRVSVNVYDFSGASIAQNPVSNFLIAPGTSTGSFAAPAPTSTTGVIGYCRVTGDGPPRSLLVSLCNSNRVGATDNCVAVVVGQSLGGGGF